MELETLTNQNFINSIVSSNSHLNEIEFNVSGDVNDMVNREKPPITKKEKRKMQKEFEKELCESNNAHTNKTNNN